MATTFTPTYIGREFVRQYYTMLYKDPTQLHRFYMKHSLFTHASISNSNVEPVTGQEAIHKKIMELNFRNCYSRIKSVDSQKTINGGVVVQVAGELTNCNMPIRKFTQTFVLEAEAPQRYYVLNDIFRYHDEEIEYEEQPDDSACDMYSADENEVKDEQSGADYSQGGEEEPTDGVDQFDGDKSGQQKFTNGNHHLDDGGLVNDDNGAHQHLTDDAAPTSQVQELDQLEEQKSPVDTHSAVAFDVENEEEKQTEPADQQEQEEGKPEETVEPEGPPQPVTWAALAKKNTPVTTPPSTAPAISRPAASKPQTSPHSAPITQRAPRRREEPQRKDNRDEGRRKFSAPPPDNHQIFIGNLPNSITDTDIRELFKEYGNIVEVRLNPKNFGFVAFDAPEPAEKILKREKPIVFGKITINVEEKRATGGGGSRGGPRREFSGRPRNDSGSKNGTAGGRQGQSQGNRDRPRGGQMAQQKQRGQMNTGEGKGENARGPRNRDRGNPIRR